MMNMKTTTFKMTKKMWIAWALMFIGAIMIISSFFISDPLECNADVWSTIFTQSFTIFGIGMLLLMVGIAMADVEYHQQTGWHFPRRHVK